MNRMILRLAALVLMWQAAGPALGHFLFIRVEPAGAGVSTPRAEVFFSEQATAGDPMFVDKIAQTRLWHCPPGGKYEPLAVAKQTDRLTAGLPTASGVVAGICEYGVLTRDVPFLLRYYPKAIAGDVLQTPKLPPRDAGAPEIMATFSAEGVTLTLIKDGKAVPDAVFTTVDESLNNEEIKADAQGHAQFKPKATGYYCVYTKLVTQKSGEAGGKAYTEIREFPTIAFPWSAKK